MTTDIVERLREANEPYKRVAAEAAAEIEAIRRRVEIAWAAGLFEGEGAICCAQKYHAITNQNGERRKAGFRWWAVMHSTDHDVLKRFHAVVGAGKIYDPYQDKRSDDYKPQLRWATTTLEDTQTALRLLLPYLGERRSAKATECLEAEYVRVSQADHRSFLLSCRLLGRAQKSSDIKWLRFFPRARGEF